MKNDGFGRKKRLSTAGLRLIGLLSWLISVSLFELYPLAATERRADAWCEDLRALLDAVSAKSSTINFNFGIASRGQTNSERLYPTFAQDIEALASEDRKVMLRLMQLWAAQCGT